jgi:NAD(P)-dependent dehydrogenase (short-subunit alcohol dehydrogenase family)
MLPNLKNLFDLTGKAALITGGGSGLGRAIAEGMAQFGAAVSLVDASGAAVEAASENIVRVGGKAIALRCDVTQREQVEAAVARTAAEFGKVDVLAAVAGIGDRNPAEDMTEAQWDRVLGVNLKGVWLVNQAVGTHMIAKGGGGSIINMSSIAGQVGLRTGNANYGASKGGVIALTRTLAIEWARFNIRVNAIAPVQFKTPLVLNLIDQKPETQDYFLSRIPLGRLGEVWEIVGPAVFLASNASTMVTGIVLNVDGGHTAE